MAKDKQPPHPPQSPFDSHNWKSSPQNKGGNGEKPPLPPTGPYQNRLEGNRGTESPEDAAQSRLEDALGHVRDVIVGQGEGHITPKTKDDLKAAIDQSLISTFREIEQNPAIGKQLGADGDLRHVLMTNQLWKDIGDQTKTNLFERGYKSNDPLIAHIDLMMDKAHQYMMTHEKNAFFSLEGPPAKGWPKGLIDRPVHVSPPETADIPPETPQGWLKNPAPDGPEALKKFREQLSPFPDVPNGLFNGPAKPGSGYMTPPDNVNPKHNKPREWTIEAANQTGARFDVNDTHEIALTDGLPNNKGPRTVT